MAARHLAGCGAIVTIVLVGSAKRMKTKEASLNWRVVCRMPSIQILIVSDEANLKDASRLILDADIVLDAILGTGVRGVIRQPHADAIDIVNESRALKVALDIPSGLDPDTGEVHERAVRADFTMTFHKPKRGLAKRPDLCGEVRVASIGLPPEAENE